MIGDTLNVNTSVFIVRKQFYLKTTYCHNGTVKIHNHIFYVGLIIQNNTKLYLKKLNNHTSTFNYYTMTGVSTCKTEISQICADFRAICFQYTYKSG